MREALTNEANKYIHPWAIILTLVVSIHLIFAASQGTLLQAILFELRNPLLNLGIAYTLFLVQKYVLRNPLSNIQSKLQKIFWASWFFIIGLYGPLHSITLFDLLNRYIIIPFPGIIPIAGLYVVLIQFFEGMTDNNNNTSGSPDLPHPSDIEKTR